MKSISSISSILVATKNPKLGFEGDSLHCKAQRRDCKERERHIGSDQNPKLGFEGAL